MVNNRQGRLRSKRGLKDSSTAEHQSSGEAAAKPLRRSGRLTQQVHDAPDGGLAASKRPCRQSRARRHAHDRAFIQQFTSEARIPQASELGSQPEIPDSHATVQGEPVEQETIPETPGATRRTAKSAPLQPSLAHQAVLSAKQRSGATAEPAPAVPLEEQQAPILQDPEQRAAVAQLPIQAVQARPCSPSVPQAKQGAAGAHSSGQKHQAGEYQGCADASTQRAEQEATSAQNLPCQAAQQRRPMTVKQVEALGRKLRIQASQNHPRTEQEAKALRATLRAMHSVLHEFTIQAAARGIKLPGHQPVQSLSIKGEQQEEGNGCGHLEDNIEVALGDSLSLPASTLATAKSLRAIDALLLAKGVRFQSLDISQ